MFRLFVLSAVMFGMVGCASKASTPSVQSQLDEHLVTYAADKKAQEDRDSKQDAAISELYSKLDRVFAKK